MNFNSNPILYPKDDGLKPTKDNGNRPCYPKEDGLNPFKAIVERINALESVTRNYGDSFETKQLTVSENAQIENLNATEGTVDTLNSTNATVTTSTVTNSNIKNAEVENLNVTTEIKVENLKTEEPVLSNSAVGYDENGKIIPIKIADYHDFIELIYPIGSLYWSSKSTNPATLFGGTWVQIKDKFVLACGDTYTSSGATGGASTVTLSVDNMPSHTHSFTPSGKISSTSGGTDNKTAGMSGNATGSFSIGLSGSDSNDNWCVTSVSGNASRRKTGGAFGTGDNYAAGGTQYDTVNIDVSHTHTAYFTGTAGTTGSNGSGTSFSILPPYVVKYCWERTA